MALPLLSLVHKPLFMYTRGWINAFESSWLGSYFAQSTHVVCRQAFRLVMHGNLCRRLGILTRQNVKKREEFQS